MTAYRLHAAPGNILVADDQLYFRQKISFSVKALGHRVNAVEGVEAAILHLKENPVDLILLDIMMPEIDGFEFLQWIRQQTEFAHIPVIVISASDSDIDVVVKAIKLGAVDFLPKNFAPPVLCARIETALRRKRNRDIEIEQEKQIETLKRASELLEKSIYDPAQLRLERVTTESTPLGNFARVFSGMAQQVYDRESRLRRQAQTLRGFGLLLLTNLSHVAVL